MAIEEHPDAVVELMELAVTWPELDYSEMPMIPPERWMNFVESHQWGDPDRAERIFSVAVDVARAAARAGTPGLDSGPCRQVNADRLATILAGERPA